MDYTRQAGVEIDTEITGRYVMQWEVAGNTSIDLLHYALPHQQVIYWPIASCLRLEVVW